jgi:hypothetical protein
MNKFINHLIDNSNGKIMTVTFVKQDGSIRRLNGRVGVRKHLKQTGESNNTIDRSKYIVMYDLHKKGYRSVNRHTIKSVAIDGVVINV